MGNVWSDIKIEAWENKNVYCSNCGFDKDEHDHGSILEMRYQMCWKKIRFFFLKKKRYLVNGVNEDGLNKDYLDTCKNELVTRLKI